MTRARRALASAVLALVICMPMAARAQSGDSDEMKRLSHEATRLYRDGKHRQAAETYLRAYDAEPHPNLLKNAAVAWYQAGRCTEAVRWSTAYEQRADDLGQLDGADLSDLKVIRAKCAILDARSALASGNAALAAETLLSVPRDLQHAETLALFSEVQAEIAAANVRKAAVENAPLHPPSPSVSSTPDDADAPGSVWPYAGWISVGVGAGLLATQGVIALILADDVATVRDLEAEHGCSDAGGETICGDDIGEDDATRWSEARERVARWDGAREVALIATGTGLVGFGVVVLLVHYLAGKTSVAIAPSIRKDGAGAALRLTF